MNKKDLRQPEWTTRIVEYKASGLTMADWCSANGVTLEHTARSQGKQRHLQSGRDSKS